MPRMTRTWLPIMVLALIAAVPLTPAAAQTGQRCFAETGYCISGRIREFWERNGGLPVFGLPIAPQQEEQIEGRPFQVQWFERNRLELHPENQRPYDVLLGRLGVDRLDRQGRSWYAFPKSEAQAGCRFFPETGHNACGDILRAWRASGLELDGRAGKSEAESLALFGLPLGDAATETIDGKEYTVQWFERARFELHPENRPPYNVLLGLLGNEVRGPAALPAQAPKPGAADLDGSWRGTTGNGKPIAFTISGRALTHMEVEVDFDFGSCRATGTPSVTYYQGAPAIAGNSFTIQVGTRLKVNGTFNSNTSASGTLEYEVHEPGCVGAAVSVWSATKQ